MWPAGISPDKKSSRVDDDLYVSNTFVHIIKPVYGSTITRWRPRKCPFSFCSISTLNPFRVISAKLPPSKPAEQIEMIMIESLNPSFSTDLLRFYTRSSSSSISIV